MAKLKWDYGIKLIRENKKGIKMAYARINMIEYASVEEKERTIGSLKGRHQEAFPELRAFAGVETSATSVLTISIYDDEEAAERAGIQSQKFQVDKDISDLFVHEGTVKNFFIDDAHLESLKKLGL